MKSTYAKVHGSVSVDALHKKEAEKSACGKVHDPAFKITEIYFQEKLLFNFLVKNGKYGSFRLDFGSANAQFRRNIHEEVFDAKKMSYSELGFASRILHHKFMLHGL